MDEVTSVTPDVSAESSPAISQPVAVPREPKQYQEWRETGKLPSAKPERKPSKEDSTPSASTEEETSSADEESAKSSPASEPGTDNKQEKAKPRSAAESRLNELLADLKKAGLSPSELKNFKRELKQAEPPATPEKTAQPEPQQPKQNTWEAQHPKPKLEDFNSIEEFTDSLTDWKADKREFERTQREAVAKQQREINEKLTSARARYGEAADTTITEGAKAIFNDGEIPAAVKAVVNDSPVLVDLLYTLGSKDADLADFVKLAKTNPGQAIRKAVLLEQLVTDELAKGTSGATESAGAPERGEDGKFLSSKQTTTPVTKVTKAPPPPREASGRSAAPPDEVEQAAKTGDFASYRAAQNRRDIARLSGK